MPAAVDNLSYVNNRNLADTGLPWWGTGTSPKEKQFNSWITDAEAKAALDWTVELVPSGYQDPDTGLWLPVDGSFHVTKVDPLADGQTFPTRTPIGTETVTDWFKPVQNDELIEFGSILVDDFGAKWDTVGSLCDHKIVFATLRLDVVTQDGRGLCPFTWDGSEYFKWLMLSDRKDGNGKFRADIVKVRGVCLNTVTLAQQTAKSTWGLRHVGDISGRVAEARKTLELTTKYDEEFAKLAERMANTDCELDRFEELSQHLFPTEEQGAGVRSAKANEEKRAQLRSNFIHSGTIDDDWRFTDWGAFNAVTEWSEHIYTQRPDKRTPTRERRMMSTLVGGPVQKLRDRTQAWLLN